MNDITYSEFDVFLIIYAQSVAGKSLMRTNGLNEIEEQTPIEQGKRFLLFAENRGLKVVKLNK